MAQALQDAQRQPVSIESLIKEQRQATTVTGQGERVGGRLVAGQRRAVGQPIALYSTHPSFTVTASIGLGTIMPNDRMSTTDFLQAVDRQLYAAKQNGRNRIETVAL